MELTTEQKANQHLRWFWSKNDIRLRKIKGKRWLEEQNKMVDELQEEKPISLIPTAPIITLTYAAVHGLNF